MGINKKEAEFVLHQIFNMTPRQVPIERGLMNLLIYLHTGGRELSNANRKVKIKELKDAIKEYLTKDDKGIEIINKWFMEDIIKIDDDVVKDSSTISEAYPLHISLTKLQKNLGTDGNLGFFIYTVIQRDEQVKKDLKDFFCKGIENDSDRKNIDMETLTILKLLERPNFKMVIPSLKEKTFYPTFCVGHANIIIDDIKRILAYKDVVPRKEIIRYLLTIIGLHSVLYYFKLLYAVPDMLKTGKSCNKNCSVDPRSANPFKNCPFHHKFFVDLSEDYRSQSADFGRYYVKKTSQQLEEYIKAQLMIKKLTEFGIGWPHSDIVIPNPTDFEGILRLKTHKGFEQWADFKIMSMTENEPELRDKIKLLPLSSFDKYMTIIFPTVYNRQRKNAIGWLDEQLGKNRDNGLLRVGKGPKNTRRYYMSAGMLEILIQIAVLSTEDSKGFYTKNMILTELLEWFENRYGILIDKAASDDDRNSETENAFRQNLVNLKEKLRELGFFKDLSDASNVQLIISRFKLG